MRRKNSRKQTSQSGNRLPKSGHDTLPLVEHLYELRRRLCYIAISVSLFGAIAYATERHIITALLRPAGTQTFIYTSPIDGINFLFRVCFYVGIALSIPVVVYQLLRYVQPLFKKDSGRLIIWGSVASGLLALVGMAFGYFIGLPAALHFLLHQFITKQIEPLLTIQAYLSFVTMYMVGSALLLQVPLILIFINRIKPLKPQRLLSLKYERWVIVGSFVLGGVMNPDPNLLHQVVIVGPLIVMYQVGVGIIWLTNHTRGPARENTLQPQPAAEAPAVGVQAALPGTAQPALKPVLLRTPAASLPRERVRQPKFISDIRPRPAKRLPDESSAI